MPAVPAAQKSVAPPIQTTTNGPVAPTVPSNASAPQPSVASNSAAMSEATRQATAAVAAAMAKLPQSGNAANKGSAAPNAVEQLTQKVSQMRTPSDATAPRGRGRGGQRGANRGNYNQQARKVEVPKDDYDFETANAKFNKEDLIKEAIASGSPVGEGVPELGANGVTENEGTNGIERKDSLSSSATGNNQAYNRSTSFFDNISSEMKDREESKTEGGRVWRGEEMKKNMETFGQGSVDGGFRGGYRGRGRGRGFGRGQRGYGGRGGGFRGRGRGGAAESAPAS